MQNFQMLIFVSEQAALSQFTRFWYLSYSIYILTDFKNATLSSIYIFQNTVVCKIPLLRWCQPKLASSANTLILIVQLNWTTLFAPYEISHLNIS